LQRSDAKLDFQPIDEEGRFSFDDYETVAEITFTKAVVESARNNSERLLSFCFQLTNSIEEGWFEDEGDGKYYTKKVFKSPCRSTSVGDIIQNMDENKYWVVAPVGFNRVFPPVNAYLQMARRRRELEAEDELEGVNCYMCGEKANYIFEDLPTGAKPFCTEKCLCDYAGFPYMGEGYYGLRPIGGEPFNVKRVLQNTGRLDWRKDFNAPVKKEIGAEGMIYFVLVPFSLAILGSIGLGRILNRRTTENNGDTDGLN